MIPPGQNARFAARMEDLLSLYAREDDPRFPVVCVDEMPVGLVADRVAPLPARPGTPAREDHEYERRGSATVFAAFRPKAGERLTEVCETRNARDFARRIVDGMCPRAERVLLVLDNLNTHAEESLYKAFEPAEARRVLERVEFHFTPLHGSWLNMVEMEFSVLGRQCLSRRIGSLEELRQEVAAWTEERNRDRVRATWTFDLEEARTRLARIYPEQDAK